MPVLGLPLASAAANATVADIDRLLNVGAVALALRVIEQEQPAFSTTPVGWQSWERRRLAILESRQRWTTLIERVAGYPQSLPDDFWIDAQESAARAHLASGNAGAATTIIAQLIWGSAQDTAMYAERVARLKRWRAMLADSYLLAGQFDHAQTTVLRYRLDYATDPEQWRLSHAKALMRAGHSTEARELLIGFDTTEVAYLKLLLRARNASVDPVELLSEMSPFLGGGRLLASERAQLWAALADAAARYRDHEVRVTAMEQAIALRAPSAARDRFVSFDGDTLWDAYDAYAAALANEARLLVGRFDAWLVLADQGSASGDPKARAMYAYLSTQTRDVKVAELARAGLVKTLAREPRGLRILGALYLDSRRYAEISALPARLRVPLIAYAVDESRLDLAARLLAGVDAGSRHGLSLQWRAPLAVALIGNGKIDEAVALFGPDFAVDARSDRLAIDAAVRVALALQAAGEYTHSAALMTRALAIASAPQERRELLLLAAQAEGSAGRHDRAARLYIASAAVPGGGPADAWSRSARLQAARALALAGLDDDALGVVEATLADTADAHERVFLEHAVRRY